MENGNIPKFLIITDESLSSSISRALKLKWQNTACINIVPSVYSNLEKVLLKLQGFANESNIRGIILTDILFTNKTAAIENPSGIEIIKHIRLTKELGNLCLLPIVLITYAEIMYHLKTRFDNIILLSPGCYPIQVPFRIDEFLNPLGRLKHFSSLDQMKEEIKEFIVWSKEDENISKHDNFNRYGPFKLLLEHHHGGLFPPLSDEYKMMIQTIWFKKFQFREPYIEISKSEKDSEINKNFKEIISGKKILFIDDEHRLGWSFALYCIICDTAVDKKSYLNIDKILRVDEKRIKMGGGKFVCIDNFDTALEEFESYEKNLKESLTQFANSKITSADIKPFDFDLVILDIRLKKEKERETLPEKTTGIKLLEKIKSIDPSIPVIVFTASEKAINYQEVINLGVSGYWIKVKDSASKLKSEIIKCITNAKEIRSLWLDIKKVEAKKQLTCYNRRDTKLYPCLMDASNQIIMLLKESFLLLQKRELTRYERAVCDYTNYRKIAMNMGLIQEIRLNIKAEGEFGEMNKMKLIPNIEHKIRDIRKKAVHFKGECSFESALNSFKSTLELCLSPENYYQL